MRRTSAEVVNCSKQRPSTHRRLTAPAVILTAGGISLSSQEPDIASAKPATQPVRGGDTPSREQLLRRYADAKCQHRPQGNAYAHSEDCSVCNGTGLAPRFDALRGEHQWERQDCRRCGAYNNPLTSDEPSPYCLRTDLGSIVRAAAACGLWFNQIYALTPEEWYAALTIDSHIEALVQEEGSTPEDAAARAFVAAVPLP